MPQWRKTHEKVIESQDFNDMPDFFCNTLWLLLPLGLDREGRGIYNFSWIKSKLFPLRMDVTHEMIQSAMTWLVDRKMIKVYSDGKRDYFHIPTFHVYQGDTSREAESVFPAPPESEEDHPLFESNSGETQEQVESNSGETQEQVESNSGESIDPGSISSSSDTDADSDSEEITEKKKSTRKKREPSELFQIAQTLAHVTCLDFEKNRGRLFKEAKTFKVADIPRIQHDYSPGGLWYSVDWRGKKGQPPTPGQIRETWGNLKLPQNGKTGPNGQTEQERLAAARASIYGRQL